MAKRGVTYLFLAAILMLSAAILAPSAEAVFAVSNMSIRAIPTAGPFSQNLISGTVVLNATLVGLPNTSNENITNVTFFRNDTRAIICQNTSLLTNVTPTIINCTLDTTTITDIANLVIQAEAYNNTFVRSQNISFMTVAINNSFPEITGVQPNGFIFTGLLGDAVNNLSIAVNASVINCSLNIGANGNYNNQVSTVVNRNSAGNCTYQFTQANGFIGMAAFDILWNATDGVDYRTATGNYIVDLQQNKHVGTPIVDIAQTVGKSDTQNKNLLSIAALVIALFGIAWFTGKK